jgi:hypothetical protein
MVTVIAEPEDTPKPEPVRIPPAPPPPEPRFCAFPPPPPPATTKYSTVVVLGSCGVIELDDPDAAEVPLALVAVTVNV